MYVKSLLMQVPVPTRPVTVPIGFKFVQVMYACETFGGRIGLAKMAGFVIPRWVFLHIRVLSKKITTSDMLTMVHQWRI